MTSVSFQGESGAYSEAAALSFFDKKIETIPLLTFSDVLEYTKNDKTDYSILPVENSIEGSVGESYDLLYSTNLQAVGEIYHRIIHCLIGFNSIEKIIDVLSFFDSDVFFFDKIKNLVKLFLLSSIPSLIIGTWKISDALLLAIQAMLFLLKSLIILTLPAVS